MATPFAKAAKRGGALMPVPMMLALPSEQLSDLRYWRTNGPVTEVDPASARPKPSKIDFLVIPMICSGMSLNFVLKINSETYRVTAGSFEDFSPAISERANRDV